MAENASTVFNVHVPEFVDVIWVALRDPTLAVREKFVETLRACGWYYPKNVYYFFSANRVLADSCTRGNPKEVEQDVIFILIGLREIKDVRLFKILDNSQVFLLFQPLKAMCEEPKQWKKILLPSSMFHVPEFVDAIWVALWDPMLAVREKDGSALALRQLVEVEARDLSGEDCPPYVGWYDSPPTSASCQNPNLFPTLKGLLA
ncbi:hypothetical protein MTR67_039122 [Solanum verrucosum]|uniref:Uncharacterized protein n=1 Tax=Solanum verrucosum TaxID=315347 RepID=A0AAF0ZNC4_SOLVR|nr:hypothetical protein MTR67_039122 [Solanum verrucosum]